jgi:hypothetical protein
LIDLLALGLGGLAQRPAILLPVVTRLWTLRRLTIVELRPAADVRRKRLT